MHRHTSLIVLLAVLHAGVGCGTDRQPLKCQNDDACPADATCQVGLCTALPAGECRLPAACRPPANSTATCDDRHACGFTCNDNYHLCSDACLLESPDSCGDSCTKCDVPTDGTATCVHGTCGMACGDGQHVCSGACITESKDSCGAGCVKCKAPAQGIATCVAGQCGASCDPGSLLCPQPDGGSVCLPGVYQCPATCDSNHVLCSSGCCARITSVATGESFSCALTSAGGVQCWGDNSRGQLGNGKTYAFSPTPVDVVLASTGTSLTRAIQLSAYNATACALTSDQTVFCWGDNFYGQAGAGNGSWYSDYYRSAVPVLDNRTSSQLTGAAAVSVGFDTTCILLSTNSVECSGSNHYGQLGIGSSTPTTSLSPLTAWEDRSGVALTDILGVSAGIDTYAVTTAGSVKRWGFCDQCSSKTYIAVDFLAADGNPFKGVRKIAAGDEHHCALMADGTIQCWGYNETGELGVGSTTPVFSSTPLPLPGIQNASALSVGNGGHSCAIVGASLRLDCWGENDYGQLGNNSTATSSPYGSTSPVLVVDSQGNTMAGFSQVATGKRHTCAAMTGGTAMCWGSNANGQLGSASIAASLTPVLVRFDH